MSRTILLVLAYISCNAIGDLMVSHGMRETPGAEHVLLPWVIGGVAILAVGYAVFLGLLKDVPLSVVVPAGSGSFMLIAVLSRVVLHEDIPPLRWVGTALVSAGVALVMLTDWQRRRAGEGMCYVRQIEPASLPLTSPGSEPHASARGAAVPGP